MAEEIIGSKLTLLVPERYREAHRMGLERLKTTGKHHLNEKTIELDGLKKDGSEFPLVLSLASWKTSRGLFISGIIRDITDRKRTEEKILQLAYHDSLTGLPNRRLLIDRLKQVLSRDRREKKHAAVLFLDLDKFKSINDTMGHAVGDELLKAVSEGLEKCIREEDTLARHGGDEFIILLHSIERIEDLIQVAERVLSIFKTPFTLKEQKQFITTSIGISIYPQDGNDPETLLRNADIAMYSAKKDGSNKYKLYNQM
jgi:diguanylate cyclase (GGDEF)-like protein